MHNRQNSTGNASKKLVQVTVQMRLETGRGKNPKQYIHLGGFAI